MIISFEGLTMKDKWIDQKRQVVNVGKLSKLSFYAARYSFQFFFSSFFLSCLVLEDERETSGIEKYKNKS